MGDAFQPDGRKRRIEATQLRKTVFGKKHSRLDDTKVGFMLCSLWFDTKTDGSATTGRRYYQTFPLPPGIDRLISPFH